MCFLGIRKLGNTILMERDVDHFGSYPLLHYQSLHIIVDHMAEDLLMSNTNCQLVEADGPARPDQITLSARSVFMKVYLAFE